MGITERKAREKEAFRQLVLDRAHEILKKEGLEALTMRSIANGIEYSQSKIYEFFENKDRLCETICEEFCKSLLKDLEKISPKLPADKYLKGLILKTLEFHAAHPHSDELFTLVCFGGNRFSIPLAFKKIEQYFKDALAKLKSPYLQTEKEIESGLNIIRCIFIGVATIRSASGVPRHQTAEKWIEALLRGWK